MQLRQPTWSVSLRSESESEQTGLKVGLPRTSEVHPFVVLRQAPDSGTMGFLGDSGLPLLGPGLSPLSGDAGFACGPLSFPTELLRTWLN